MDDSNSSSATGSDSWPKHGKPKKSLIKTANSRGAKGRKVSVSFASSVNVQNVDHDSSGSSSIVSVPRPTNAKTRAALQQLNDSSDSSAIVIARPEGTFNDDSIEAPVRKSKFRPRKTQAKPPQKDEKEKDTSSELLLPENPEESIVGPKRKKRFRSTVAVKYDRAKLLKELKEIDALRAKERQEKENQAKDTEMVTEELREAVINPDRLSINLNPPEHTEPGIQVPVFAHDANAAEPTAEQQTEPESQAEDEPQPQPGPKRQISSRIPRAVNKRQRLNANSASPKPKTRGKKLSTASKRNQKRGNKGNTTFDVAPTNIPTSESAEEASVEEPAAPSVEAATKKSLSPAYPEAEAVQIPVSTAFDLLARLTPAKQAVPEPEVLPQTEGASTKELSNVPAPADGPDDDDATLPFDADAIDSHNETAESDAENQIQPENEADTRESRAADQSQEESVEEEEDTEEVAPTVSDKSLFRAAKRARKTVSAKSVLETPGPSRLKPNAALGINDVSVDEIFNTLKTKRKPRKPAAKKAKPSKKAEKPAITLQYAKKLGEFYAQKRLSKEVAEVLHKGLLGVYRNVWEDIWSFCDEKGSEAFTDWTSVYEFFRRQNLVGNYNEYCALVHRYLPDHIVKNLVPTVVDGKTVPKYDPKIIEKIDITLNETRMQRNQSQDSDSD